MVYLLNLKDIINDKAFIRSVNIQRYYKLQYYLNFVLRIKDIIGSDISKICCIKSTIRGLR